MSSARVVRSPCRQVHGPGSRQVQVRHLLQDQRGAQAPGQQVPLLGEQTRHPGPDGAKADQADFNGFHLPFIHKKLDITGGMRSFI